MIQKDKEPKNVTDRVKANLSFLLSSEVTTVEMCVLFLSHIWTMCVYVCVCVYVFNSQSCSRRQILKTSQENNVSLSRKLLTSVSTKNRKKIHILVFHQSKVFVFLFLNVKQRRGPDHRIKNTTGQYIKDQKENCVREDDETKSLKIRTHVHTKAIPQDRYLIV